ncbi:NifB/NifX family molybdenum-iron cluster-binding protein [Salinispira pacifica]
MRIAVACEGEEVSGHFGRCRLFRLFDAESGAVKPAGDVPNAPEGHSAAVSVLRAARADAVIVGGIGARAVDLLETTGISVYAGAEGSAVECVRALLAGTLKSGTHACSHHGGSHEHHQCDEEGHESGSCSHNSN